MYHLYATTNRGSVCCPGECAQQANHFGQGLMLSSPWVPVLFSLSPAWQASPARLLPQCTPLAVSLTLTLKCVSGSEACGHGGHMLSVQLLRHFAQANSTALLAVSDSLTQRRGFKVHVNMPASNVHQVCTTRSGSHVLCTAWSHTQDP